MTQAVYTSVVLLGVCGVGKTTTYARFLHKDHFWDEDTAGDLMEGHSRHRCVTHKRGNFFAEVRDFPGDFDLVWKEESIRISKVAYLIYSVASRHSFKALEVYAALARKINPGILLLILGNKIDLEEERRVTAEEGNNFALSVNGKFLEVSMKNGYLENPLSLLGDEIFDQYMKNKTERKCNIF